MFTIEAYLHSLINELKEAFGVRLIYVGLQGGYRRGEATENSDIDIMLVLDNLCPEDMDTYRGIIGGLEGGGKACGFICGKKELSNWNRLEICQLIHETESLYGELAPLMPEYTRNDVANYVKLMTGNLYHELCHRYIYTGKENSAAKLPDCFKPAFYILQNLHYLKTGDYILKKSELLPCLSGLDYDVLNMAVAMINGQSFDFDAAYRLLFDWCKSIISTAI